VAKALRPAELAQTEGRADPQEARVPARAFLRPVAVGALPARLPTRRATSPR
jgi:hypothetical protein